MTIRESHIFSGNNMFYSLLHIIDSSCQKIGFCFQSEASSIPEHCSSYRTRESDESMPERLIMSCFELWCYIPDGFIGVGVEYFFCSVGLWKTIIIVPSSERILDYNSGEFITRKQEIGSSSNDEKWEITSSREEKYLMQVRHIILAREFIEIICHNVSLVARIVTDFMMRYQKRKHRQSVEKTRKKSNPTQLDHILPCSKDYTWLYEPFTWRVRLWLIFSQLPLSYSHCNSGYVCNMEYDQALSPRMNDQERVFSDRDEPSWWEFFVLYS